MNKKLIISKSITFLFVVAFVVLFKTIFGAENTLIGVTTITAALMFLSKDMTVSPVKNTVRLIVINVAMGIASILAVSNVWLGIAINLVTVFAISYSFCYNLANPMYFPFSLQYLFLIAAPVATDQIGKRLLALVFGALFIMLIQLIANKNRMNTSGNKLLISVCESIIEKINNLEENHNKDNDLNSSIKSNINAFRKMIYDKREGDYYLTEEGRIKLNLSVALENIYFILDKINNATDVSFILDKVEVFILEAKEILANTNKDDLEFNNTHVPNTMKDLLTECEEKNIVDLMSLQLLDSIVLLHDTIYELRNLNKKNYNVIKEKGKKPEKFNNNVFKYMFGEHKSLRICYAVRVSICITIGAFIMDYFNLSEGKWIMFTLLSLINPLYETSQHKTKYRLLSTLVGAALVTIIFSIFKDTTSRTIILMIVGYIQGYLTEYKYSMITTTISAIGAAALIGNVQELTLYRIAFVILGTIIAIIANKYLLPYKLEDSNNELEYMHSEAIKEMLSEIYNLIEGIKEPYGIKNLLIVTSLIEDKIKLNNQILNTYPFDKIIKEQRFLVTNIYELYMWIIREKVNPDYIKCVLSDIRKIIDYKDKSIDRTLSGIHEEIIAIKDIKTKITLSSIYIILAEIKEIEHLKKAISE